MRFVWKVIFFIYNVLLIVLGAAVTLLALGYRDYFSAFATLTQYSTQNRMATLTIGLAMILIALIMILLMFYRRKKKVLVVTTEKGHKITVSVKAAQNMVLQSLIGVPGIREVTPEIYSGGKGISVRLHVTVEARQNVPSLCEEMQKRVKDHLIYVSGLKVTNVTLLVENVVPVSRSRTASSTVKKENPAAVNSKPTAVENKKTLFSSKKKNVKEEKNHNVPVEKLSAPSPKEEAKPTEAKKEAAEMSLQAPKAEETEKKGDSNKA